MRQFALPGEWVEGDPCVVEGGRARYLTRVLRLAPGDSFPGIDIAGKRWLCELREAEPDRLVIAVAPLPEGWDEAAHLNDIRSRGKERRVGPHAGRLANSGAEGSGADAVGTPARTGPSIILVQGLPKGAKMDLIVRQAAEAGVSRVIPLVASRSIPKGEARRDRWQRIAREAIQQSGSTVPTRVDAPIGLDGLEAALGEPRGRRLRLLLDAESQAPLRDAEGGPDASGSCDASRPPLAQTSLHEYLTDAPEEIILCVGPEGGFAVEETRALAKAGFSPLKLPCAVLRTETAALFAVAAVETILSERFSWIPRIP